MRFITSSLILLSLIFSTSINAQSMREIGFDIGTLKTQSGTPSSPVSGKNKLYVKDGNLKLLDSTGAEKSIGSSSLNQELVNGDFESGLVSWTIANGTPTVNTSTQFEGKQTLSIALTGALSLSQSSTINAAQKSGVQMVASIWVNSSDVSDLQLCSLKNGSEDKCTVTGGYVQGSGWRQLTVSFLGDSTSNGLKLKSTDTTGTVLVDQAYAGIGSPVVDFTPDMVYSAAIGSTGVVSQENTDFIDGNCAVASNVFTCNFKAGTFSVDPNCVITAEVGATGGIGYSIDGISSTAIVYRTYTTTTAAASAQPVSMICQKQGADYKTSKAYVASGSLALNTTVYSAKVSSADAVSEENTDFINGNCTNATTGRGACNYNSGIFTVTPNCTLTAAVDQVQVFIISQSSSAITYETRTSAGTAADSAVNITCQKQGADYQAAFNPVIVGSFQGYNETPGTSRVETFSVSYGTTNATTACSASPCSYLDQIGNAVTSITRASQGSYSLNTSKTYSKLKCQVGYVPGASWGSQNVINCSNCNTQSFQTVTTAPALADSFGTLICQGIPQ